MISEPPDTLTDDDYSLVELYEKRVKQNQDLFVVLSDHHNRRGTGKTVASLRLAHAFDRTDEGLTKDKVTLDVPELTDGYTEHPEGSALVLDEAEAGTSKYEASSATNKALRKLVSMGRIEEKYVIANLPNSGEMDRDLKALADVWIVVTARGAARCHILGYNPYEEHPTVRDTHPLAWDDIPVDHQLRDVYNDLTRMKRKRLRGGEMQYVPSNEVESRVDDAREDARRETRNELIRDLYHNRGFTQQEIADLESIDVSRGHIANIV